MKTTQVFPVTVGKLVVCCETAEDRQLIQDAVIACQAFEANAFSHERLMRMSKACAKYKLNSMEQITEGLAARSSS